MVPVTPANESPEATTSRRRTLTVCLLLGLFTAALYAPVLKHQFITIDDNAYVTFNPRVQAGLTWESVVWAFRDTTGNWHPVTWLSHMFDYQLYGLKPAGHHLTNVLLHIANAVLLFLFLKRSTAAFWPSAFVGCVFAIHPLHVESVAWVAERKDVLCAFFGLMSLLTYARYVQNSTSATPKTSDRKLLDYLLSLGFFALGLMSKPMLVTWPFLLLLLDYWPFGRVRDIPSALRRLILEKLPFFCLAIIVSVVTVMAQKAGGAVTTTAAIPLGPRLANAFASYFEYFAKTFWPSKLAIIYPWVRLDWFSWPVIAGTLLLLGVTIVVIFSRTRRPWLGVGWFWFVGLLVPVIGLVQVGIQAWADRYSYLPQIGLLIGFTWLCVDQLQRRRVSRTLAACGAAVVLIAGTLVSERQISQWKNTKTLFEHALAVTDSNYVAYAALAGELIQEDRFDEAEELCQKAIQFDPSYSISYSTMGDLALRQRKMERALSWYGLARDRDPVGSAGFYGLALTYLMMENYAAAEKQAAEALRRTPDEVPIMLVQASACHHLGKLEQAAQLYERILKISPGSTRARQGLGNVLAAQGETDQAIENYLAVLRIHPEDSDVQAALGSTLLKKGRVAEAEQHFLEALRFQSTNLVAASQLAILHQSRNEMALAVDFYRKTLNIKPDLIGALNNLAWILASDRDPKLRNGSEALGLAQKACELTKFQNPTFIGTLAAAYAELGQFTNAVSWAEKSRDLALTAGQAEIADRSARLVELFRTGRAFHVGE